MPRLEIGVYIGDRSSESALKLWNSLPPVYRKCAVCYTDFWDADQVIPAKRHKAVGKDSSKTNRVENSITLWGKVSRLVRKTLSFSKNLENHIEPFDILRMPDSRAKWHAPAAWATKNGNSLSHFAAKKKTLSATVEQTSDSGWHLLPAQNRLQLVWLETCRLTIAVFWYYKQWRETGVLDEIMDKLHGKVREQAQKNRSGQP